MASSLAVRSQPFMHQHDTPYSTSEGPRLSHRVAQARLYRSASQDNYMSSPQSQPAVAHASADFEYGTSVQDARSTNIPDYDNLTATDPQANVSTSQNFPHTPFNIPFSPTMAPHNFSNFRSMLQDPRDGVSLQIGSHGAPHPPFEPTIHDMPFSQPRPQSHTSHLPSFPLVAEIAASLPCMTNTPPGPPQYGLSSTGYTAVHQEPLAESSLGSGLQFDTYHSNSTPTPSYHAMDYTHSTHPAAMHTRSLYTQPHPLHYPAISNERRDSVASTLTSDTYNYPARVDQGDQYSQPRERSLVHSSITADVNTAPPLEIVNLPRSSPPAPHTPTPYDRPSLPEEREMLQANKLTASLSLPAVGSAESVRRRLNIMYDSQRQQSEQSDRDHTLRKALARKSTSRRRKSSQSDESEFDGANSASKHKDAAARYKSAYERVKLQRDFYEGATTSLLHQVRMLGGDPMQASKRASKGENLDPKKARLLIASLQQALENSREKLIDTQTELYSLRQTYDDAARTYSRSPSDDYLKDDDSEAPLSAAPSTIYNHHNK